MINQSLYSITSSTKFLLYHYKVKVDLNSAFAVTKYRRTRILSTSSLRINLPDFCKLSAKVSIRKPPPKTYEEIPWQLATSRSHKPETVIYSCPRRDAKMTTRPSLINDRLNSVKPRFYKGKGVRLEGLVSWSRDSNLYFAAALSS